MVTFKIKKNGIESNFNSVTLANDEPLSVKIVGCEKNYRYKLVATLNDQDYSASINSVGLASLPPSFFNDAGAGRMALDLQRYDFNGQIMYERYNLPPVDVKRPVQGGYDLLNLVNEMKENYNDINKKYDEQHAKLAAVISALSDIGVALELSDEGE